MPPTLTTKTVDPPPVVTKPLSVDPNQKFEEGAKAASLTAEITCREFAKISWFKDSAPIFEDGDAKYRMIWNGNTKRLVVNAPLSPEDSGVYEIVVEHKGSAKVSSLIDVHVTGWGQGDGGVWGWKGWWEKRAGGRWGY